MKQVTIDNVRERIAELEMANSHGELSLRGEFELACLRMLAASLERIAELEEIDREQMAELYRRNATIHRLQQQAAPVITDDRLLGNLETRINSLEIGERKGALSTQQATSLKAYRLAVQCLRSSATSNENATDNTAQQFEALAGSQAKPTAAPIIPEGLHPDTADLVIRFATALAEKLHRAEQKYGHANGWMATGWYNECLRQLWDHVEKGDPLDVAAYCAFMWHHGWVTTDYDRGVQQALSTSAGSGKL